jgi:hypothetical protein
MESAAESTSTIGYYTMPVSVGGSTKSIGKCPETATIFALKPAHVPPILHIGATFLGETTFRLEYQHEML